MLGFGNPSELVSLRYYYIFLWPAIFEGYCSAILLILHENITPTRLLYLRTIFVCLGWGEPMVTPIIINQSIKHTTRE
jgi:hypothetical protein